ncbi:MAG: hypothetical protein Q9218_004672 [Villophora microphyllina]
MGLRNAWERDGFAPAINAEAYHSEIFTIIVGPEEKRFKVHAAHLSQSPVFGSMCNGQFREGQNRQIDLPEDDHEIFEVVVQYLYSGDFCGFEPVASESEEYQDEEADNLADKLADNLADVYLMAEKYQLEDLQSLAVRKLDRHTDPRERPIAFLLTAQKVYNGIPNSDTAFRGFFKRAILRMRSPESMDEATRNTVNELLPGGELLVVDTVAALSAKYHEVREDLATVKAASWSIVEY